MDIYAIRLANLREVIRARFGGVARRFALDAGVEPNYVSRLFSANPRGQKRIGDDLARKWEARYGLPRGWMDSAHHATEQPISGSTNEAATDESWCRLTVRSWVEAERMPRESREKATAQTVLVPGQYGPECYLLVVRGDSMVDPANGGGFPPGCHIVIDPNATPRDGSFVVVRYPGVAERALKQMIMDGAGNLLKPLNPRYPITEMDHAEVVGVVREKLLREVFPL